MTYDKNITEAVSLRLVNTADAKALSDIYRPFVENTAISFEYTAPDTAEFVKRIENKLPEYPYIVAEHRGEVIGYAYASEFIGRPAYKHSVETTVYLKDGYSRLGVGKLLYTALEELLKMQNVLSLNACIAVTDTPDSTLNNNSMLFHNKMGYRYVGRFNTSGYKFGRFYDMIWMEKLISEPTVPFPDFVPFASIKDKAASFLSDFRGF